MKLNQTNLIKGIKEFYQTWHKNCEIINIGLYEINDKNIKYKVDFYEPITDLTYTTIVIVRK